jgi:hypothetical protein
MWNPNNAAQGFEGIDYDATPTFEEWLKSQGIEAKPVGFMGKTELPMGVESSRKAFEEGKVQFLAKKEAEKQFVAEQDKLKTDIAQKGDEQLAVLQQAMGRSQEEKDKWSGLATQFANERANVGTSAPILELEKAMRGDVPSAAEAMLKDESNRIAKQQIGQAYSRAANPAVARAAMMAGAEAQQTAVSQSAVIRAQEQATARQQWASAYINQQGQLAQLQIQAMGGATSAEQMYQQALYGSVNKLEADKNREFETAMQNLKFDQQKQLAQIGYEWQQAQQEAARNEALIPTMVQGAIGGAAAGGMVGGPWGAVGGAVLGATGGYATNKGSTTAAPSYGYGQFATTAGASALQYRNSLNKPAATPSSTESALGSVSYQVPPVGNTNGNIA